METLNYEIIINAPIQEVWDLLWDSKTYPQWTQFFKQGSKFVTDWQVGGKTYFLDDADQGGVATIMSLQEPYEVVFSHLGTFINGIEDTESKEVKEWSGAEEKYFLRQIEANKTELRVVVHAQQNHEQEMNAGFSNGLALLKKIAES